MMLYRVIRANAWKECVTLKILKLCYMHAKGQRGLQKYYTHIPTFIYAKIMLKNCFIVGNICAHLNFLSLHWQVLFHWCSKYLTHPSNDMTHVLSKSYIIVADGLMPVWHLDICNHHGGKECCANWSLFHRSLFPKLIKGRHWLR